MANCRDCDFFQDNECKAIYQIGPMKPVNRLRACVIPITENYCSMIREGDTVLEIGCGVWSPIREHCLQVGAHWEGVDISRIYLGKPTIATRIESVENLSFDDQTFDYVIGNQTFEHWNEFGCRPEVGLWQCFRVCKLGGQVLLNVPIHFHGARMFVEGEFERIEQLIRPYASEIVIDPWGQDRTPLDPVDLIPGYPYPGERASYQIDIRATRADSLPPKPPSYRIRSRVVREIRDHRPSYLVWKVKQRLRLLKEKRKNRSTA